MNEQQQAQPFKHLGERLRNLRQKLHESVADVSGAVEIDELLMQRIEQGRERPSEDILMLLISHFDMREEEASNLWQLAGYDKNSAPDFSDDDTPHGTKSTVLVLAVDPRIMYSDSVQVSANQEGLVVSFGQSNGNPSTMVTSRIGMSREHARTVIRALQDALENSEPRRLPDGKDLAS